MQTKDMTAEQKLAEIEKAGWPFAWDGCHKIYFLPDEGRVADAEEMGYDIYPVEELRQAIADSCSLVFVSKWGYDNPDFEHPFNINQCDESLSRLMGWPVDDGEDD